MNPTCSNVDPALQGVHYMTHQQTIEAVIRRLLETKFEHVIIRSVRVQDDEEDVNLLRVEVVFDSDAKDMDGKRVSGFLRSLRPALSAEREDRFPVISFMSQSDRENFAGAA
jgi:hypothetical protein